MTDFIFTLAARQIDSPPGAIIGPIARLFGNIINFLLNGVQFIGYANSLGIAIVLMTIIFRLAVLPMHLKSQKSMMKVREIKPELDKIDAKYGKSKDPELMRKAQQEKQALMAKHGANPLTGCLPMLLSFPLFIGLNMVMRQSAVFIASLRTHYEYIAAQLIAIPELIGEYANRGAIWLLADVPQGMLGPTGQTTIIPNVSGRNIGRNWNENLEIFTNNLRSAGIDPASLTPEQLRTHLDMFPHDTLVLGLPEDLAQVISRFNGDDWDYVYQAIANYAPEQLGYIQGLVENLASIETFLGISMVETSGWGFPGVIIPLLTGISMFVSSWIMQQRTYDPNAGDQARMMGKVTLYLMPAMMAFFTVGLVSAVGVFWTMGQLFQIVTDVIHMKKSGTPIRLPFTKPPPEVVDVVPSKKKK